MLEFGVDPAITYTRRLGRTDDNRIRPLLVGLQSADVVSNLLIHTRNLRRSTNEVTRKNVFINKNMTKMEARLAYRVRIILIVMAEAASCGYSDVIWKQMQLLLLLSITITTVILLSLITARAMLVLQALY